MMAHNDINPSFPDCDGNPGAMIYAVTTNDCPCGVGYIFNAGACICDPCRQHIHGCLTCSSMTVCTGCDIAAHFLLSGTSCVCDLGYAYTPATDTCDPVCGDGYVRAPEGCDDANLISGDGCNSVCAVETNYTCTTPLLTPSNCSYTQPIEG